MPHIHYTCDITATNVSHHTHCIDITPSLYDITIGIYIYSIICTIEDITSSLYDIKPPFLWHHTHYIWHRIHAISVITSTVLMISQQLYLWDLIHYIWRHLIHCIERHIHYICNITATVSVSSQPLFGCYHTLCMYDITPLFVYHHIHYKDITSTFYDITPHYLCHHMHCTHDITPTVSDIASTISVSSQPLYWRSQTYSMYDITPTLCMI